MNKIDHATARLLNELQDDFPLTDHPYAAVGARIDMSEDEVVRRLREARSAGVVRQVCGIFDTKALGFTSTLVAARVAPERLAHATAVINAHPGVSHNYRRDHDFNLWYTIAVPPGQDLSAVVARLWELSQADSMRELPTVRLFKIGVTLDIAGDRAADARGAPKYSDGRRTKAAAGPLTERDIAYVRTMQEDLADIATPFDPVAESLGISVGEVIEHGQTMIDRGQLRRVAAILNNRQAGFSANGMAVWNVPPDRVEEFGQFVAGYRSVSHCYQRPSYPDWPYNVFSMIHGPTTAEVESVAGTIADATGITDHRILYSSDEYKKIRLPYFIPDYDRWEELCERAADVAV